MAVPLTPFPNPEPLTDAELHRLGDFLKSRKGGKAMNLEELDGFFSALIAGPEPVMPSEYNRELFGCESPEFSDLDEAQEIMNLMMRHWNKIASTLYKGEIHVPMVFEDEKGELHGNDWARGFMRGMHMRHDGWAELVNDEKYGDSLIPMMILYHEHDEDPEMRPEPITPDKREKVIALMATGLINAYEFFRKERDGALGIPVSESQRSTPKVGRNNLCPCGSGKKFKKCCGGATVN